MPNSKRPSRILAVGHFKHDMFYGIMQKLVHGFIRLGHNVHWVDDRRVARGATIFNSRKWGIIPLNNQLIAAVDQFRPEIILIGHAEMIWNSTLKKIKDKYPDTQLVYRNVDWLEADKNVADIQRRAEVVDFIFSTSAGEVLQQLTNGRVKVAHMPNPIDVAIDRGRAFANENPAHHVFYSIGGVYDGDPRPGFIKELQQQCDGVDFAIHGMKGHVKGAKRNLFGADYIEALTNCRMGLNYSRRNDLYLYSSDRMAQYLGNGLLVLQDRASGFGELFEEDELAFYSDVEELTDVVNYYAKHDDKAKAHAKRGWEAAHRMLASERVAGYMLGQVEGSVGAEYEWPMAIYK